MASGDRHTGRNVALVGGAALVAWLLWRRKAKGLGGPAGSAADAAATSTTHTPKPCRVWVRADRIEVDGAPADLATVVARCRESGRAEVRATGDAITRSIITLLAALKAAGVIVDASPDVAHLVAPTPEMPA
jgi:hypothetical protein